MPHTIFDLAQSGVRNLTPYQPGKPVEELERELGIRSAIKLASNENPLGSSPKALQAVQACLSKSHIYPDGGCYALKQALAKHLQVHPNQLTMGNGSENVLEIIVKTFLSREDEAIISEYCFLTIAIILKSFAINIVAVKEENYKLDLNNMLAAITEKTKMIFIVNPNNPTGSYVSKTELENFLKKVPRNILVILDEAYYEFSQEEDYPQTLPWLSEYKNVIITRTFSKAYGLAGLRLGYSISSSEIADYLNRARLPFNVNSAAAAAGIAALDDHDFLMQTRHCNKAGLMQLEHGLASLGLEFIPSVCNFITIRFVAENIAASFEHEHASLGQYMYEKLLYEGIIVRPLNAYQLYDHVRVTIGTAEQNTAFLRALKKCLTAHAG